MMVFSHILMGILFGALTALFVGEYTTIAVIAGLLGGFLPDVDMVFVHRKTLHFPVYYSLATFGALFLVILVPAELTLGLFVILAAAALHSVTDILGGGKEMRPWEETDDRAVYNHYANAWVKPRRIFYDGSVPDLLASVVMGVICLIILSAAFRTLLSVLVGLAITYTVIRRWITTVISDEFPTFSSYIQHQLTRVSDRFRT